MVLVAAGHQGGVLAAAAGMQPSSGKVALIVTTVLVDALAPLEGLLPPEPRVSWLSTCGLSSVNSKTRPPPFTLR